MLAPAMVRRFSSRRPVFAPAQQIGCAGCAGMFPYMLGVTASLQQRFGPAIAAMRAVGGASAGCFGGLLLATGIDARRLHEDAHLDLVRSVARRGGPVGRWNGAVSDAFTDYLDAEAPDAHARATGRFHVSLSRVSRRAGVRTPGVAARAAEQSSSSARRSARGVHRASRAHFASNADLVDAMIASAFVPLVYATAPPWLLHRGRDGRYYVDASLQDPRPTPLAGVPRLLLHHRMFRRDLPAVAPISCDADLVDARFRLGYDDAEAHAAALAAAFADT